MNYKEECFKRLEYTNKYSKYEKEDLIDEIQKNDKEIERLNEALDNKNNEIERLNKDRNKLYENGLNDFLELQKKRAENERLNNIINELEKYFFGQLQMYGGGGTAQEYYDKLQELKGE